MRTAALLICATILMPSLAVAEEKESKEEGEHKPLQTYMVEITEVQLSAEAAEKVDAKQLAQALEQLSQDGQVERLEKVRVSVLAHHESTAQFSKQVAVTQGLTVTNQGRMRNTMTMRLGTMIQVNAEPHHQDVFLKLKYEASRLGKDIPEDTSPDIESVSFASGLLVRPGKTVVATASTAQGATYLLVSIVQ